MKKIKSLMLLVLVTFLLTGCVKFNANMEIRKDKSMSYSIIYAMNSSLMGDSSLIEEDDRKELEENGFVLEEYNQDGYKGFVITKNFSNIDDISLGADTTYNVSGLLNGEANNQEVFNVTKGFLKNTYTAKFTFNSNDKDGDTSNDVSDTDEDNDDLGLSDSLSQVTSGMDLSFNVKLPYSALSNNATSANDDNTELKWELTSNKTNKMEFSFELYNMTNIYIACGLLVIIVAGIVVVIVKKRK